MKTVGLIGGMSWESTACYYKLINEYVKQQLGGLHSAKIILFSVNFAEIEHLQRLGDWQSAGEILADAAQKLQAAGADFLVLCTNTMHIVAPQISEAVDIPLLHIVDPTAEAICQAQHQTIGLIGTRFTMEQAFYRDRLTQQYSLKVITPDESERQIVHDIIFNELCRGEILDHSRSAYQAVINHLIERGAQAIILGCTEIALLIGSGDVAVPIFDTTALHAAEAGRIAVGD